MAAETARFVIITDAIRKYISTEDRSVHEYQYRQGDLGLVHPSITRYFSQLENGCDDGDWIVMSQSQCAMYAGCVPVLVSSEPRHWSDEPDAMNYFFAMLKEHEFKKIRSSSFGSVLKAVNKARKKLGIEPSRISLNYNETHEDAVAKTIEDEYRVLLSVMPLYMLPGHKNSHRMNMIPVEDAKLEITNDDIADITRKAERQITTDEGGIVNYGLDDDMYLDFIAAAR